VLRSEDFRARPAEVYAEVLDFLGLRPWDLGDFPLHNRVAYPPIDPELRRMLEERFREPNARLERLLDRDFGWGPVAAPAEPTTARLSQSGTSRKHS
jgi:hypothetical protein